MTFATATSGQIRFKHVGTAPPAVEAPTFLNYTQTYNTTSQVLVVRFSIAFPDCTLPVEVTFDAA
ncbi:MAG: hypothetical protein ACREDM_01825 [Methylocella sp.]